MADHMTPATRAWTPPPAPSSSAATPASSAAGISALRHRYGAPPTELEPATTVVVRVELDDQAELVDRLVADLARVTGRTVTAVALAYGVPA